MQEEMIYSENGMNLGIKSLIDDMTSGQRISREFYIRDVIEVAPDLIGKNLVVKLSDNTYRGSEDRACHAFKGRTRRTEIMFLEGGRLYVYLIYGMYWMLNIVTGEDNNPQAVLIRGVDRFNGPGKITKSLGINETYYGEDLCNSKRIWLEDDGKKPLTKTGPRIGIDYAGEYWKSRPWRYYI